MSTISGLLAAVVREQHPSITTWLSRQHIRFNTLMFPPSPSQHIRFKIGCRKDRQSSFHHCEGAVELMLACLSARRDRECSFHKMSSTACSYLLPLFSVPVAQGGSVVRRGQSGERRRQCQRGKRQPPRSHHSAAGCVSEVHVCVCVCGEKGLVIVVGRRFTDEGRSGQCQCSLTYKIHNNYLTMSL